MSGAGTATGGESGGIVEIWNGAAQGQPVFSVFHRSFMPPPGVWFAGETAFAGPVFLDFCPLY
jgi:hypothetical protein